jgi:hypothetical protein
MFHFINSPIRLPVTFAQLVLETERIIESFYGASAQNILESIHIERLWLALRDAERMLEQSNSHKGRT